MPGDQRRVTSGWWARIDLDVSTDRFSEREAELAQQVINAALKATEVLVRRWDVVPFGVVEARCPTPAEWDWDPLDGLNGFEIVPCEPR